MEYQLYNLGIEKPLSAATLDEARAAFEILMNGLDFRLIQLASLVGEGGIQLDFSDNSIRGLEEWLGKNVEPSSANPRNLASVWYSLTLDIGLYFGELMIQRAPALKWVIWEDAESREFKRHVVSGITDVDGSPWCIDICRMVAAYGHQVIDGANPLPTFFMDVIHDVVGRAER